MGNNVLDITGQKFGRLSAVKYLGNRNWLFSCDCGNEKIINGYAVRSGQTKSCGCYISEKTTERSTKHKMSRSRLYRIYASMKQRCFDEKSESYSRYGGRGITICDEWLGNDGAGKFMEWALANGYDENAPSGQCTIDRIDNNGNYCPQNCRWVNMDIQAKNKSKPQITICGETHSLKEWSNMTGLSTSTLRQRIKAGWKDEEIIYTPKEEGRTERLVHPCSKIITYNGETHNLVEWSKICGISNKTISERLRRGYSVEEALFKKKGANRSSNVIAENITTGEKLEFESQKELAECIGSTVSNVNKCVKGKLKQTCGYKIYYNK